MKKIQKGLKDLSFQNITEMMMLNQVKKEKKTKNPNPTLGGMIDHFINKFK